MNARWLKSVVKHSRAATPVLPYHRDRRQARRNARLLDMLRSLRTA